MTRRVGFARAIEGQDALKGDIAALRAVGVTEIVTEPDPLSSARLRSLIGFMSAGDELTVVRSSHLAPSLTQFVRTMGLLTGRGVRFTSLEEPALSTRDADGNATAVLQALDELRRDLISIRTKAGMTDAAAHGRRVGRPTVMTEDRVAMARELRRQRRSIAQIARVIGVSQSAVRRVLVDIKD